MLGTILLLSVLIVQLLDVMYRISWWPLNFMTLGLALIGSMFFTRRRQAWKWILGAGCIVLYIFYPSPFVFVWSIVPITFLVVLAFLEGLSE
ncbi:hypothetical protein ACFL3C_03670 [Patescibacteria group bacterium]